MPDLPEREKDGAEERLARKVDAALRDHDRFDAWRSTLPVSGRPPYPSAEVMAHVADYVAAQLAPKMASDWIDRQAQLATADRPEEAPDVSQE
jgi:hypothetical protein